MLMSKSYLYVFEVYISLLAEIHNWSKEVEKSFITFKRFKQVNQRCSCQLLMIFCCNLNTDLQILSDVVSQHGFQAFQWVFNWESTKIPN